MPFNETIEVPKQLEVKNITDLYHRVYELNKKINKVMVLVSMLRKEIDMQRIGNMAHAELPKKEHVEFTLS